MIMINPEFKRNMWLELSQHRLIGMPALLLAIFYLTYLVSEPAYTEALRTTSMILYFLLTLLWGTRLAGDSLVNEIKDHTWDQQRMSSLSPWSMAWGKLFGSTLYVWYGAAFCLLTYIFAGLVSNEKSIVAPVLVMLSIGVLGQSIALLTSMQSISKKREYSRSATTSFMLMGIITAAPFINLGLYNDNHIQWYGTLYAANDFYLISLLCFCGWSLVAIYRKMREELQFRNYPIVWFAFSLFLTLFATGLVNTHMSDSNLFILRLVVAFMTFGSLTYAMILIENKDPLMIRRYAVAIRSKNWLNLLELTPAWLVTLIMTYLLCPVLLLVNYSHSNTTFFNLQDALQIKPTILAITLFLTRDILLILYFNLNAKRKRADMTAIIYLAILYWLVPSLLVAMGLSAFVPAFLPFGTSSGLLSIISGLSQMAILAFLIFKKQRN